MTSEGCPFNCPYCASRRLYYSFHQKNPQEIVEEILYWYDNHNVLDFAFYDDALLVNFDRHLAVILEEVCRMGLNVRFHAPNAMHARFIGREAALLFKQAGFTTIRLGLERIEDRFDNKVTTDEFRESIEHLKNVGFTSKELGAYVLYGIPEEDFDAVKRTVIFLEKLGAMPYLAEFSPIPHTPFF
ncbi:MAG: radical SAM protein [Dissulfuribacterales bacterium]